MANECIAINVKTQGKEGRAIYNVDFIRLIKRFAAGFFLLVATHASAQHESKTPFTDQNKHLGVATCSGSTCHSRQEATGIVVRQNEIQSWQDETSTTGAHLRAYKTLLTNRSKNIASRLGIGPAHEAKECLSCHSAGITRARQGPKFQLDDGINCESCHGGSEDWISQHYAVGTTHADNVELGLYPLENPKVRATVCLSCHLGSDAPNQFVGHDLMAAGHPRMSFELDLFTDLQRHHDEDFDYMERKDVKSGVYIWAIGQAMTVRQQLRLFANEKAAGDGLFPELVFFDCLACHRPISEDPNWRPLTRSNPGRPDAPGQVKFNDANMIMLLATAEHIMPEVATKLDASIKQFHYTVGFNASQKAKVMADMNATVDALSNAIESASFSKVQTLKIMNTVVEKTLAQRYTDYAAAEQAIMAIDTLLSSMIAQKQVSRFEVADMRDDIEKGYQAVEDPNTYDQDTMIAVLTKLQIRFRNL